MLDHRKHTGDLVAQREHVNDSVRAKAEHMVKIISQASHLEARWHGLNTNTERLTTMFALSNL